MIAGQMLQFIKRLWAARNQNQHESVEGQPQDLQRHNLIKIREIEKQINALEELSNSRTELSPDSKLVVFFIASTSMKNIGFATLVDLLTSWSLRAAGHKVKFLICQKSLDLCVHGTNRDSKISPPPCNGCMNLRGELYPQSMAINIDASPEITAPLQQRLKTKSWEQLRAFTHNSLNVGRICLSSLRWLERRNDLEPTKFQRHTLEKYIASAVGLAHSLDRQLDQLQPQVFVVFNGSFFPEAIARAIALKKGIRVVTHEGGHNTLSEFFSHGLATDYNIEMPKDFHLSASEEDELDQYLNQRFKGQFMMGGRPIWPSISSIPTELAAKIGKFQQIVPVFTNVVWDTSQLSANIFFEDMFCWLKATLQKARQNPNTLFIVRAHPDELRTGKASRQPLSEWLKKEGFLNITNIHFIAPNEYISSYELIRIAKFCIVYNSTIGMEVAMLGKRLLVGGRSRYHNKGLYPDIKSQMDYNRQLEQLLIDTEIHVSPEWKLNARRFFYYSIFKSSLDFSPFVSNDWNLKEFNIEKLIIKQCLPN